MRLLAHIGVTAVSLVFAAASCGASSDSGFSDTGGSSRVTTPPGSHTSPTDAAGSPGNSSSLFVPDASTPQPTSMVDGAIADAFVGCAATTVQAKLLPLDLYFILDTSFSMDDLVSSGRSKWQAVTAAITTFVNDPASAGLGVGLQYFPGTAPGVPASCKSSTQCGAAGPCVLKTCQAPTNQVIACDTNSDCVLCDSTGVLCEKFPCEATGSCANSHDIFCTPGTPCGPDANGFDLGDCQLLTSSFCSANDDCTAKDYQTPAVGIAPLPANAPAIAASLGAHEPLGNTPTQAALQGAIAGAEAFASSHPNDTVVVVLATDGQPDEIADGTGVCTAAASVQSADSEVAEAAAAGLASTPSIKTFGIGVFTPSDIASGTAVLTDVATSGGTSTPFIIGTASSTNVEQDFSNALSAIRGASLPCNYTVPVPVTGSPNFFEINVQFTAGNAGPSVVPYVESAARCDATVGGWYYNADPAEGGTPTTIDMCPASCNELKGSGADRVDIALGCKTQTIIH